MMDKFTDYWVNFQIMREVEGMGNGGCDWNGWYSENLHLGVQVLGFDLPLSLFLSLSVSLSLLVCARVSFQFGGIGLVGNEICRRLRNFSRLGYSVCA